MTGFQVLAIGVKTALRPMKMITQRSSVQKIWYDSNRANDHKMPSTFMVQLSNGFALLVILLILIDPLWLFFPRATTPLSTSLGKFRFFAATLLCHGGLVLWPIAIALLWQLPRQRIFREGLRIAALLAFCLWEAWGATRGVVWIWSNVFRWVST